MAEPLGDTTDDRDVTREIVGGRIGDAATGPSGPGAARRSPTAHTYAPARIARQGANEAFRRASSTGRHAASPAEARTDRPSEASPAPPQAQDASDSRAASDAHDHHDDHTRAGLDDERGGSDRDDRSHPIIRATVRWSLAIIVTVGLTYLLVTLLLDAMGRMAS